MGEILLSSNSTLNTLEGKPKQKEMKPCLYRYWNCLHCFNIIQIEVVVFRVRAFKFLVTGAELSLLIKAIQLGPLIL
jgi:hypothetical protein